MLHLTHRVADDGARRTSVTSGGKCAGKCKESELRVLSRYCKLRRVGDGDRTHGHWSHNPALYQLSYAHQNREINYLPKFTTVAFSACCEICCDSVSILPKLGRLATAARL